MRVVSYFQAPITNKVPDRVMSLEMLHRVLTTSELLRQETERVRLQLDAENPALFRSEKQHRLPYVTPAGVFSYCKAENLEYPNGLFVVDIDHLPSAEEAARLRDVLFQDELLRAKLAFVSPSTKGVKLFLSYEFQPMLPLAKNFRMAMEYAWLVLSSKYDVMADRSGTDIARTCFLAFDPEAKFRP
jgi:hypothetical protein